MRFSNGGRGRGEGGGGKRVITTILVQNDATVKAQYNGHSYKAAASLLQLPTCNSDPK